MKCIKLLRRGGYPRGPKFVENTPAAHPGWERSPGPLARCAVAVSGRRAGAAPAGGQTSRARPTKAPAPCPRRSAGDIVTPMSEQPHNADQKMNIHAPWRIEYIRNMPDR